MRGFGRSFSRFGLGFFTESGNLAAAPKLMANADKTSRYFFMRVLQAQAEAVEVLEAAEVLEVAERWAGILPDFTSSYHNSWCSLAHVSST